jgi:hypothetical protein
MLKRLKYAVTDHPLLTSLVGLRGNPRACVYTEPLWGIPIALRSVFYPLYVRAGVNDQQIGFSSASAWSFKYSLL